ncbi:alpha-amylase family glycosyl hydrolase [Bacillus sp. PS06]|uniref:alpha-amylase family glycosyl hydrolase n=1 Tax=Bacillus sp. PS06 TaxID=2764176 RepID=UPI001785D498|nr:alpha-amylase family glycosyl hydrolase [Bacillus sp. PS06]MBD8067582.1 alpha-amylase [Bacillus sp. PS06]
MKSFKKVLVLLPLLFLSALYVEAEVGETSNELIYSIMIDRFNNSDPANDYQVDTANPNTYHGGDLDGVEKKLDYIKDMGFTTILLSSAFQNGQGYEHNQSLDYFEIERHFGTKEDLKRLVDEAHKKELKIMIEFPGTDVHSPEELLDAALMWINETGIDGYQLTKMNELPFEFWQEFYQEISTVNEEFIFLAEPDKADVAQYESIGFTYLANPGHNEKAATILSAPDQALDDLINTNDSQIAKYVDNKDSIRFTRHSLQNKEHPVTRLKLALSYLYLTPGVPVIYYGTEIVQDGGEPPTNSPLMNFRTDDELEKYMTMLSKIRSGLPSITKGVHEVLHQTEDGMVVIKASYDENIDLIVINNSTKTQKVTIDAAELAEDKQVRGLIEDTVFVEQNGEYTIILDREKAEVFHLEEPQGVNIPFVLALILIPGLMIGFFMINRRKHRDS